jgi:hypothetical protein
MDKILLFINTHRRNIIVGLFLLCLFATIAYFAIFRVLSTSPNFMSFPTSTTFIDISLSQPVESVKSVQLNNNTISPQNIHISGFSVRIEVNEDFQEGRSYQLSITGMKSKWLSFAEISYNREFTPTVVNFSQLSKEQQKILTDKSNSNQSNDPFLNNKFPIARDDFTIEASKGDSTTQLFVHITLTKDIPDYDVSETPIGVTNSEAEKIRNEALKLIKLLGGTPDKYYITYSNQYLTDKYTDGEGDYHD